MAFTVGNTSKLIKLDDDAVLKARIDGLSWLALGYKFNVATSTIRRHLFKAFPNHVALLPHVNDRTTRNDTVIANTSASPYSKQGYNTIRGLTKKPDLKKQTNQTQRTNHTRSDQTRTDPTVGKKVKIIADENGHMGRHALPAGHPISCNAIGLMPYWKENER